MQCIRLATRPEFFHTLEEQFYDIVFICHVSPFFMTKSIFESPLTTCLVSSMSPVEQNKDIKGLLVI